MFESTSQRINRVRQWLDRLRALANPSHRLGQLARRELPTATGLSIENVAWALKYAFEIDASDENLRTLVDTTPVAQNAHVILSANVFTGALRAIAIALASSRIVKVRPSRREPLTAKLMDEIAPDMFELVGELDPRAGDHVWAYGADATLASLRASLPRGVVLHAHGDGYGAFVVDASTRLTPDDFSAMALDIAAFDQRGCLSPRFAIVAGSSASSLLFAEHLRDAMTHAAEQLPYGVVDDATLAATARHREIWRYLGEVIEGPGGLVTVDVDQNAWGEPPTNRTIHVRVVEDLRAELAGHSAAITAVGTPANTSLAAMLASALPNARQSPFGHMQRPILDGPVDRRGNPAGMVL